MGDLTGAIDLNFSRHWQAKRKLLKIIWGVWLGFKAWFSSATQMEERVNIENADAKTIGEGTFFFFLRLHYV